jgi:hypothetical protein
MVGTGRANNCIRIPTSLQGRFFRTWIEYLPPLHNLTNREKDVVAAFVKARFELSKSIIDDTLLDKVLMSDDVKSKIREDCNVSSAFFQVILGKLRKIGVIENDRINPKFIPKNMKDSDETFYFLLYFDLTS